MKKKGLIISTIVMVVVLIASLTTATYAWFSATATASVEQIAINTTAAEGLEIALSPAADTYWSGSITVTNGTTWEGDEGFGPSLTMASGVGTMTHAVTKVASATTRYPFIVKTADTFPAGATATYAAAEGGEAISTATVNTTVYCTYAADSFIVPVSYEDGTAEPNSYTNALVNSNYLWLPIVIRTTSSGIKNIYYKVTLTPTNAGNIKAGMMPGMAAASRITYSKNAAGSEALTQHSPFSSWSASGSSLISTNGEAPNNTYSKVAAQYQKYVYYGVLVSGTEQAQSAELPLEIYSWIEGTDPQCINATAGSGYTIDIEFLYDKSETAATAENIVSNAGWKSSDPTNLT